MPNYAQSMGLFEKLFQGDYLDLVRRLMNDLLDVNGRVRFKSVGGLHDRLTRVYGFALRMNSTQGVRPGGRHLFYVNGPVLIRVKTSGTERHPTPHMTVSLAEGLGWPDEAAKFNRQGDVVPRVSSVDAAIKAGMWRSLQRLGDTEAIFESDDRWADACHFDFVAGFDASGAPGLPVTPA